MEKQPTERSITEGVIWKQLLIFFFPILLGSFFQQMYNTVDTIIVGRFVGMEALAAVGASTPIVNLINGFFIGISTGGTVILSQFYGARDRSGVSQAIHTSTALALVLGVVVTVLGMASSGWMLRLIGTPEGCLEDAILYSVIYFSGSIATMVYNMGAGLLRAMGDSRSPTIYLIWACVTNVVLDLLFVVVLHMGVAGVGLATVASQVVSAVLVLRAMVRLPQDRLEWRELRFRKSILLSVLLVGIPSGLQAVLYAVSNLIIQAGVNSFGDVVVAAWTAYSKTDAICWMIVSAFGVSITTFVGQNFGAEQYHRIRKSVWVCMAMAVGTMTVVSALLVGLREPITSIYTTDREVIRYGAQFLLYITLFCPLYVPIEIFSGAMRGTGYSVIPTIITGVCVCVLRILWIAVVVSRWHSLWALTLSYPISWGLCGLVFAVDYFRGGWLSGQIKRLGMTPETKEA